MIEATNIPYAATRRQLSARADFAMATGRLDEQLGTTDLGVLDGVTARREGETELRDRLQATAGASGFALFQKLDHGVILDVLARRPTRASRAIWRCSSTSPR